MYWTRASTFATRSGMGLYKGSNGCIIQINNADRVLIHNYPNKWMINGVCRLSLRNTFLNLGGHPKGIKYGVDSYVSTQACNNGYKIGYLNSFELVRHYGNDENAEYRKMKNEELKKVTKCIK